MPETAEILCLGIRGAGKTTFMTVLGHVFERSGVFGLGLTATPGTDTFRHVGEMWHRMTAPLAQRDFPATTDPGARAVRLSWDVATANRTLFRLSTLDCSGETVYRVFNDASGDHPGNGSQQEIQLRMMAARASVLCLFVRPADLDAGHSRHPEATPGARRKTLETLETLLSVATGPAGKGKKLLFVLSDSADWREEIDLKGGPKAWLFDEVPQLARVPRARTAAVLAVSAVPETLETHGVTDDGIPFSRRVPGDHFHPCGLEAFLLCVGSLATDALRPLGNSLLALQDARQAYGEAVKVSSPSHPRERAEHAARFTAAAGTFLSCTNAFLDADDPGPALRQLTETFAEALASPAQRASFLENSIDGAIERLAGHGESATGWPAFRDNLLATINSAPPGGVPFTLADLPEADSWFDAALLECRARFQAEEDARLAAENARRAAEEKRRRWHRRFRAVFLSAFALLAVYGLADCTHPHVHPDLSRPGKWRPAPGYVLDNASFPRTVHWVPGTPHPKDADLRAGTAEGTWESRCPDCRGTGDARETCPKTVPGPRIPCTRSGCIGGNVEKWETVPCRDCGGDRKCHTPGSAWVLMYHAQKCPQCKGAGHFHKGLFGVDRPCLAGQGCMVFPRTFCPRCMGSMGSGTIPCQECQGSGRCGTCNGSGSARQRIESDCPDCAGGWKPGPPQPCPQCGGSGTKTVKGGCPSCKGTGWISER